MARGFDGPSLRTWCRAIDEGPFSTISTGERITFFNPEMITTLAAAASLTSRVEVLANLVVAPLHRPSMLAKQLATIDVISEGRLVVGIGVGGRPHDYEAAGVAFERRHAQVDELALRLRELWSGTPPFEGADPIGPAPVRPGGPPLLAGAMGAKSLARAAQWADGVTGFSLAGGATELAAQAELARVAWREAGRSEAPFQGSGTFCVLGVDQPLEKLRSFATTYLSFFGEEAAASIASGLTTCDAATLVEVLDGAADAGIDEFTLVPGTWELACLDAMADVVEAHPACAA